MRSNSAYAIGRLVLREMERQKLSVADLVRRLGYTNISKGCRRIQGLLRTGFDPILVPELARALCIDQRAVDDALMETDAEIAREHDEARQRRDDHERETFRPYILVETEGRGRQGLFAAITFGKLKHIPVPDAVSRMLLDEQIAWARRTAVEHFARHGGEVEAFGAISGYVYRRSFEDAIRFNLSGRVTNHFEPRPIEIHPRLGMKRGSPISPTAMWDLCGHGQEIGPLLPLGDDHLDAR